MRRDSAAKRPAILVRIALVRCRRVATPPPFRHGTSRGSPTWRSFRSYGAPTYVTAPTMRQCKDVFLKELRLNLERGDPVSRNFFDVQATKATIAGKRDWGIIALATTKPENFQGLHHDHMSIIVDEGSGVPPEIFETIYGTLTQRRADGTAGDRLFLTCGNPNTRDCFFFRIFHALRDLFKTYTMSSLDSPLVDRDNIQRIVDMYGIDSDVYRVRVLGEFRCKTPSA